jgi:hypothetical protein
MLPRLSRYALPNTGQCRVTWERLCYLGPEIWLLDRFRDYDGLLVPDSRAVDQLRQLLGVPNVERER